MRVRLSGSVGVCDRGVSCFLDFSMLYRCSDERGENGFEEEEREWRLPDFLYADDLVLCGESEKNLRCVREEV